MNLPVSTSHEVWIRRCFDLARLGEGTVSPNPLVGSVLVHHDRSLGEGYHRKYGAAHAERIAIAGVPPDARHLIPECTLYVSLEPCCHHGRTPPCTEMIIRSGIRHVVVSTIDPNPLVSGRGLAMLRAHGITVEEGIHRQKGKELIRHFDNYITRGRPHIILKWVQSLDGFIGKPDTQVWLSNDYERVMVHKLRSEVDAIMIGTNTAVTDNPELTTRHYPGKDPVRVIIDRTGRIPGTYHLFDGAARTVVYTESTVTDLPVEYVHLSFDDHLLENILADLHMKRIQSLLVEGGAQLINSFLSKGLWDEALVVRTPKILSSGIKAPLINGRLKWRYAMAGDEVLAIGPGR